MNDNENIKAASETTAALEEQERCAQASKLIRELESRTMSLKEAKEHFFGKTPLPEKGIIDEAIKELIDEAIKELIDEAIKEFAESVKMAFYYEFDEIIPSIMADTIDNLVKERRRRLK